MYCELPGGDGFPLGGKRRQKPGSNHNSVRGCRSSEGINGPFSTRGPQPCAHLASSGKEE